MFFRSKSKNKPIAPPPVAYEGDPDLGGIGRALWLKKRKIFIPTIAVAILSFVVVNALTPRFRSETRLLLESRENVFLRAEADKQMERNALDSEAVTSQIQVVLSRDLARSIIKKEKLAERPEFDPVAGISVTKVVLGMFGLGRDPLSMSPDERILESYYDHLSVYAVEKSRVLVIEFRSSDPEFAAQVANSVAEGYLAMQQTSKQDQTRSAGKWLSGEIDAMRTKVAEAEAKIEDYRTKSNLFVGSNNSSLANQQLTEVNSQIAAARGQKADLEARARQLRETARQGKPIESSDIANSESMRRLAEQRVALHAQLAEQSSTLLDQHPRIKELKAQIAEIDRLMITEAERLARALDNDAKVAGSRLESLTASLDQVKRMASQTNEQDVQLRALEREGKAQRDLLESYLAKYREAAARDNINATPPDARIISRATVAVKPEFPKKLPMVLIATFAMFTLSSGWIVTGELMMPSGGYSYPMMASAPVYAQPSAAPAVELAARAVRAPPARHAAATGPTGSIDGVARGLRQAGEGGRRVTVVGSLRNAGTTYAAIALARALAKDAKVVLVDMAFGAPNLSVISTDPNAPGIAELARGEASFGDIITRDQFSRVHLIATGNVGADGPALAASPVLATTIEALTRTYAHVVIDIGAAPEVSVEYFAPLAPRAVLVAADPAAAATRAARERLLAAGFADVTVVAGGARAVAA